MQTCDGGKVAASGLAAHEKQRDAVVALGVVDEVFADVVAVFVRSRVGVFRGETVADADDDETGGVAEVVEHGVLSAFVLEDPAAAVDVVEDADCFGVFGAEDAAWY